MRLWSNSSGGGGGGGANFTYRTVTSGATVTMLTTDQVIGINKTIGSATAVTLPPTPFAGQFARIIDAKGDAGTNNITITPDAGTINGGASYVINTNFGWAEFQYSNAQWVLVG